MLRGRVAALSFIFVTVLLDMLALGIIVPVLPRLVVDFLHGDAAGAAKVIALLRRRHALRHHRSAASPCSWGPVSSR